MGQRTNGNPEQTSVGRGRDERVEQHEEKCTHGEERLWHWQELVVVVIVVVIVDGFGFGFGFWVDGWWMVAQAHHSTGTCDNGIGEKRK